ncbi:DJ-1/PfpI family protein [Photobacterium atrarenae]|uniref:DJ-1/PfpI family protein n=1 Tax=Photobacterium atrarenae TaxID=865757 RepID=A0ABY5GLK8_9GAMM|nr:DJ-1/PfpI family protein [Photobacterium atrarenae]UTV29985.1 DJ-1/PfpI family protein [Photobacterium atrarenae]
MTESESTERESTRVSRPLTVTALLYEQFDLLEISGPLEMFGLLPAQFSIQMFSLIDEPVASMQGPTLCPDCHIDDDIQSDILLIPGGSGCESALENVALIDWLKQHCQHTTYICTIGTGAALAARAGLMKGKAATTSKQHYRWVTGIDSEVNWSPVARWTIDGTVGTASGRAAGMDLSLALIAHLIDEETARKNRHQRRIYLGQ